MGNTNHTAKPELLPCPFCGGEAMIFERNAFWQVCCLPCSAEIQEQTEAAAIASWNARQPQSPSTSLLDAALPDIYSEGERLANETPKTNGAYLWADLVGAIQTAIAEERARHVR